MGGKKVDFDCRDAIGRRGVDELEIDGVHVRGKYVVETTDGLSRMLDCDCLQKRRKVELGSLRKGGKLYKPR